MPTMSPIPSMSPMPYMSPMASIPPMPTYVHVVSRSQTARLQDVSAMPAYIYTCIYLTNLTCAGGGFCRQLAQMRCYSA